MLANQSKLAVEKDTIQQQGERNGCDAVPAPEQGGESGCYPVTPPAWNAGTGLEILISLVARSPNGRAREDVLKLVQEHYLKEDPESILKRLVDQGIFLEIQGRIVKA